MNYPNKESCQAALEMAKRAKMEVAIMCFTDMLEMHNEIERITALVPKVVVLPLSKCDVTSYGLLAVCECSADVSDGQKYCHQCGSKLFWDNGEA
ncbi:MAG: hypothetical protein NTZ35_02865 [Ignavibacteriales bacterium]|nr:hypothetical protein [Ignavibacteriales bacterium]